MNKSTLLQKDLNKKNHHPVIQLNKYNPLGSMLGSHSAKKMQDEQRLPGQSPPACFSQAPYRGNRASEREQFSHV